jgi:death-on-curing protein
VYPTIAEKAAVLIYSIAKGHVCPNGNKRLAFVLAATFLVKNDWWLWARQDEVFDRLLAVAASDRTQADAIKAELAAWIGGHLIDPADAHVRIQAGIPPGEATP